ncbi:hypothetical protein TNCV_981441 [Trichonephila clavipes]|nr:hypothetical protein TNCV_981441 [Trichonephila clavipes]
MHIQEDIHSNIKEQELKVEDNRPNPGRDFPTLCNLGIGLGSADTLLSSVTNYVTHPIQEKINENYRDLRKNLKDNSGDKFAATL